MKNKPFITIIAVASSVCLSFAYLTANAAEQSANNDDSNRSATILGWQAAKNPNHICDGYYIESPIDYPLSIKTNEENPTDIQADSTQYTPKGQSILQGNVTVTQPNQQVLANKAYLIRDTKTGKINVIHAIGNVRFREPGKLLHGEEATLTLDKKNWEIKKPTYRLVMDKDYKPHIISDQNTYPVYDLSGWGTATSAKKGDDGTVVIRHGTFSTCSPQNAFWSFSATTINLNKSEGRGSSFNNILYIKDVPVFYSPYASFPIDNRRKTGFLFPTFSTSSDDGVDLAVPFYWNIAPNYDATITPHYNEKRGARFDGLFRYLLGNPNSTGTISGIWLPHDREFNAFQHDASGDYDTSITANKDNLDRLEDASDNRGFIHLDNNTTFNSYWNTDFTFNYATDDYIKEDFSTHVSGITDQQLLQQAKANYHDEHWNVITNVQHYQTLHPIDQSAVANEYTRLPQIAASGNYPEVVGNLNLGLQTDLTHFVIEKNPGESDRPPTGLRYNLDPSLSYPYHFGQAGYIKPKIQLDMTTYNLNNINPGQNNNPTVALPIFDIDAGLFFDRDNASLPFSTASYRQTLEPRLFYLYVPYKNQDDIPIFDTSVKTFGVNELYSTNRFSGLDRIGDANQISYSLTSRFLNTESGMDKVSATIGQILYFRNRRVQLCADGSDSCDALETDARLSDGTSPTDTFSPIVGELRYQVDKRFSATGSAAWKPNDFNNATLDLEYKRDPKRIINLGYSFLDQGDIYPVPTGDDPLPDDDHRNNLNQIYLSFSWPIWNGWSGLGRYNYNISHDYTQEYFYGLQYDSCCWAIRFVSSRYFSNFSNTADPEFKREYYLQFLFKGLGSVGSSNPSGMLSSGINGYKDPFGKPII